MIFIVLMMSTQRLTTRKMIHVKEPSTGENFQDALKDPGNGRDRIQGDCNGKRDNGLKCT